MCLAQGQQCSDAGEARTRGPSVSSQKWPCHIWHVDRMKFASSLEANKFWAFSLSILLFSLPLFGRNPDIIEILLTGTLSLNSINQNPDHSRYLLKPNFANIFGCEIVLCFLLLLHIPICTPVSIVSKQYEP